MKKVIRLTENDVEKIVKKVIRESKETYTTEGFIYLSMYYSTGEEDYGDEDYDSSQYVEGLVLSKMPVKTFTNIMGTTDVEEIVMYESDESYDLIEEMLHNYTLSVNTSTGQQISPDIQDGWTQGTIEVIDEREYRRLLSKNR